MRTFLVHVLFIVLFIYGCSDSRGGSAGSAHVCEPGETQACTCVSSAQGAQSCASDQMGWEPCQCESTSSDECSGPQANTRPECPGYNPCFEVACVDGSYCHEGDCVQCLSDQECVDMFDAGPSCVVNDDGAWSVLGLPADARCTQENTCVYDETICEHGCQNGQCLEHCTAGDCPSEAPFCVAVPYWSEGLRSCHTCIPTDEDDDGVDEGCSENQPACVERPTRVGGAEYGCAECREQCTDGFVCQKGLCLPDPALEWTKVAVHGPGGMVCALRRNGDMGCWGYVYQHGFVSEFIEGPFTDLSSGHGRYCGVRDDMSLECAWFRPDVSPQEVPEGRFVEIEAGGTQDCALREDGRIQCWRWSEGIDVPYTPEGTYVQFASGFGVICGLREDGRVECGWHGGEDPDHGQVDPEGVFTQIDAGNYFACGLREDGQISCWGGSSLPHHFSDDQEIPEGPFVQVTAGMHYACGLRPDGQAACWGWLDAMAASRYEPLPPEDMKFTHLDVGPWFSACGTTLDGGVHCWGRLSFADNPEAQPPD